MPIRHDDPRPPFEQIAGDLRDAITAGTYQPGDQLPSTRQLAADYEVAHMTVQHALAELRGEGLIVSQHGRGNYVQDPATAADGPSGNFEADIAEAQRQLAAAQKRLDQLEARKRTAGLDTGRPPPDRGPDLGL